MRCIPSKVLFLADELRRNGCRTCEQLLVEKFPQVEWYVVREHIAWFGVLRVGGRWGGVWAHTSTERIRIEPRDIRKISADLNSPLPLFRVSGLGHATDLLSGLGMRLPLAEQRTMAIRIASHGDV